MDDPENEIAGVIFRLTQTPPSVQAETIDRYYLPSATFIHPFCRTGHSPHSRKLIHGIYRWYKIMSPKIELMVNTITYDEKNLLIYANISQIFRIWFLPYYKAPVTFVSTIKLYQNQQTKKYYIAAQHDLYPVDQWVLLIPGFGGHMLIWLWQLCLAYVCLAGTWLLHPITLWQENVWRNGWVGLAKTGKGINETSRDSEKWLVSRD